LIFTQKTKNWKREGRKPTTEGKVGSDIEFGSGKGSGFNLAMGGECCLCKGTNTPRMDPYRRGEKGNNPEGIEPRRGGNKRRRNARL